MYALMSGFWKYLFQKDEYSVLILGLDNAGKTTFLEQTKTKFNKKYKGMNLSKITTTVGLNIGKIDVDTIRMNFWDLGGQEELQSLWDKYYAESHAIIYVVDSSDHERTSETKEAFDKMIANENLSGVPLLILGNKQDVQNCVPIAKITELLINSQNVRQRHWTSVAASALNGMGVREAIEWMAEAVVKNSLRRPPIQKDIT